MANVETLLIVAAWLRERCQSPGSSRARLVPVLVVSLALLGPGWVNLRE